jgi:hypothetical protein
MVMYIMLSLDLKPHVIANEIYNTLFYQHIYNDTKIMSNYEQKYK